jgi:DNA-binding transcriptional ArsR family regulator
MSEPATKDKEHALPKPENMSQALQTLGALANEQRLQILCILAQDWEMTVGQLNEHLDLSQSALSQHLRKLKDQGYVESRKEGLNVYYRIAKDDVLQILDLLCKTGD